MSITLEDVRRVEERIRPHIVRTPLISVAELDRLTEGRVLLKAECLQRTGSFKARGAFAHMLTLERPERGVIAFSSGNHGQAVADAARELGVSATIVMPRDAPKAKIAKTERCGARIVLYERETENREEIAADLAVKSGGALIPPYDHELTIAGQGTSGLEAFEQAGHPIDQLVVCCSGGGLAAGMTIALRGLGSQADIIVAEPEGYDDYGRSLRSGHRVRNEGGSSLCDALLVQTPGAITFPIMKDAEATGVSVTDGEVLHAIRFALLEARLVLEPGGAAALAAILSGRVKTEGRTTLVTLSGGNADPALLERALNEPAS